MSGGLGLRLMPALVRAPLWGHSVYQILRATRRGDAGERLRADVGDRPGRDCLNCWRCVTHPGCAGLTGRRETARAQLEEVNGSITADEVQALTDAAVEK